MTHYGQISIPYILSNQAENQPNAITTTEDTTPRTDTKCPLQSLDSLTFTNPKTKSPKLTNNHEHFTASTHVLFNEYTSNQYPSLQFAGTFFHKDQDDNEEDDNEDTDYDAQRQEAQRQASLEARLAVILHEQ